MRRTQWLQETRKMRFEEAYRGWQARRLTQEEAARLLGVCERTFRRYVDRYEEAGLEGLIDKRLEQLSHRRAPVNEVLALDPSATVAGMRAGTSSTFIAGTGARAARAAIRG
jgi:transposase